MEELHWHAGCWHSGQRAKASPVAPLHLFPRKTVEPDGALFGDHHLGFQLHAFATAFFAEEAGFFAGFAFAVAFFVVPAADFLLLDFLLDFLFDFLPDVLLEPRAAIWILPFALRA